MKLDTYLGEVFGQFHKTDLEQANFQALNVIRAQKYRHLSLVQWFELMLRQTTTTKIDHIRRHLRIERPPKQKDGTKGPYEYHFDMKMGRGPKIPDKWLNMLPKKLEWLKKRIEYLGKITIVGGKREHKKRIKVPPPLRPIIGKDEIEIKFEYGGEVKVEFLYGNAVLTETKSPEGGEAPPATWPHTFRMFYAAPSASVGGGLTAGTEAQAISGTGDVPAAVQWARRDFPGHISSPVSVSLGGAVGYRSKKQATIDPDAARRGYGGTYGAETMIIYGRGSKEPLFGDFGGWTDQIGSGAAVEVSFGFLKWGWMWDPDAKDEKEEEQVTEVVDVTTEYVFEFVEKKLADKTGQVDLPPWGRVDYGLGDSILTPDARRRLRWLCAKELAQLSLADSELRIVGHADTLDTEQRNAELSEFRAVNALQAMKDILGSSLKIPDKAIKWCGMGEKRAREEAAVQFKERSAAINEDRDQIAASHWRRVEIRINNRLAFTLRAARLTR